MSSTPLHVQDENAKYLQSFTLSAKKAETLNIRGSIFKHKFKCAFTVCMSNHSNYLVVLMIVLSARSGMGSVLESPSSFNCACTKI